MPTAQSALGHGRRWMNRLQRYHIRSCLGRSARCGTSLRNGLIAKLRAKKMIAPRRPTKKIGA